MRKYALLATGVSRLLMLLIMFVVFMLPVLLLMLLFMFVVIVDVVDAVVATGTGTAVDAVVPGTCSYYC